ncbi:uncharacterized protein zgc:113276 [Nematolebias whitei]|uniref:uncharacterized protein zgc:113276 n=1 Tax=Nematolebias whitei TaxID=451745 RepID=UPI001899ABA3|nr:uncharacterized protein zgc:113276 [Nematolebias whitei]
MLEVLIIGGGPHALTLASLLSGPDPEPEPDPDPGSDHGGDTQRSQSGPEVPKTRLCSRKKRKAAAGGQSTRDQRAEVNPSVCPPLSVLVVDTYGEWAALWDSQFAALSIPHLRSHTLVHTDPFNKKSLQEFVLKHERSAELRSLPDQIHILDENAFFNDARLGRKERKRLNVSSTLKKSLSFSLPGTKLSVDFFRHQVKRYKLDRILQRGTAERILPVTEEQGTERKKVKHFQVHLRDGSILKARRVVMATGPTRAQMANIPAWVQGIAEIYPEERLRHTVHLMHQLLDSEQNRQGQNQSCSGPGNQSCSGPGLYVVCEAGQRVLVVGGGLSSAHIVSLTLQQGASHVTWVMRKHLQLKQFDVGDVESLVGRYSHVEHGIKMDGQAYLRQFYNERSLHKRLNMIRQARKGGAVTPEAYIHLQPFIQNQQVELKTFCQVSEASWCYRNQTWNVSLSSGDHWTGDMIWLATGCKLDVKQDPLLSDTMKEFPVQVVDGWPCISESLQWTDGCPLYLMGQYAALQVGPHAVNLAGGQAASRRIAEDIVHGQKQDRGQISDPAGGKSRTEDYIQQMHGLFWL